MDEMKRSGAFALVGPGRAGATIALALRRRGWVALAVAGRSPERESTVQAASLLDAAIVPVEHVGRDAQLVVVATPDDVIRDAALALAPSLLPDALVVHLSGARGLGEFAALAARRPDVRVGVMHPLQSLPSPELGVARLQGSWCAVAGAPEVTELAVSLGMRPFSVADPHRATYHAAATVASNHLVALLGQVERIAEASGVPFEAFLPLVRATLDNVAALGPAGALTGPVARGDVGTVLQHLDAIPVEERAAYRALADAARGLLGGDNSALRSLLEEAPA